MTVVGDYINPTAISTIPFTVKIIVSIITNAITNPTNVLTYTNSYNFSTYRSLNRGDIKNKCYLVITDTLAYIKHTKLDSTQSRILVTRKYIPRFSGVEQSCPKLLIPVRIALLSFRQTNGPPEFPKHESLSFLA